MSETGIVACMIMPTAIRPPKEFAETNSETCALDKAAVCILDDDLSMLKALDRLLTSEGFVVRRFSHPGDFLATIRQAPCQLAILDVWMPDMNGLEVQTVLRNESPKTRIIFISGRDDPSVRHAAREAGAVGFLSKPFDDEDLLQLVRRTTAL